VTPRGRVLAVADGFAIVRGERGDVRVRALPAWCAGDLLDGEVVRAHPGGDYPGPGS